MMTLKCNYTDRPPRDRWVLVDLDDGSQDCLDKPVVALHLARWRPRTYKRLGTYEWQVLRHGAFDQWADGRIMGWADLPIS